MTRPAVAGDAAEPTIFALSSGAPPAAIAVVRISGTRAAAAIEALAGRLPAPRRATVRALRDGAGALLDRALVLWFPGPATATGEDLAELHLHGGRAVVAAVLAALGALPGLAPAAPGEFTRRAFANGRIDLTEAEGLADLLAADSEAQRRHALRLAEGGLGRLVEGWRRPLLAVAAAIEAVIDYDEEGDIPPLVVGPELGRLVDGIVAALAVPPAERLREGVRIVLAGPVNSGKSSLLNALAGREVAITADIPGTTRDVIEAPLNIGGVPVILIDSAGLRETDDPVERQGVARAHAAIERADLILWLGDPTRAPRADAITIRAKSDLGGDRSGGIAVSARTGVGLDDLLAFIVQRTSAMLPGNNSLSLNARQRETLSTALLALQAAFGEDDPLLIAEHVRIALSAFDLLIGRFGVEDMLDALFARFCVGK